MPVVNNLFEIVVSSNMVTVFPKEASLATINLFPPTISLLKLEPVNTSSIKALVGIVLSA